MKKYMMVKQQIEKQLSGGELKQGQRLPSIRDMSEKLGYSKATIIKAYEELEQQHIIYSVPQSGYYVVSEDMDEKKLAEKYIMDFSSASPQSDALPYKDFQHCLNTAIDTYKEGLFSYGEAKGLPVLIKTLHKQFCDYHIFTREKNIFITSGSQQAINILLSMEFPNRKKKVLLEQPTYHGTIQALKAAGVEAVGIDRSFNSIDLNKLEQIFKNEDIKCFFTIPRYSNPLGLSYTVEEKREIVRLASKYDVYIIEDDYLADVEVDDRNDSMFSLDTEKKVIYLKSFSKTLLPGLRIAAAIIPDELIQTFNNLKKWNDLSTSVLSQGALDIYIKSGLFNLHKKKLVDIYSRRMTLVKRMLMAGKYLNIGFADTNSGFFLGVAAENSVNERKIIKELTEQNIKITECSKFFLDNFKSSPMFRISVCRVNDEDIFRGVPAIANAISRTDKYENIFKI